MINKTYNLLDMGGKWNELVGTSNRVYTEFAVGEFPLQITHNAHFDSSVSLCQDPSINIAECLLFETAKQGDEITIVCMLPTVTTNLGKDWFLFEIQGADIDSKDTKVSIRYRYANANFEVETESDGGYMGIGAFSPLLSDAVITPITDNSENIIGVSVNGVLTTTIASIHISPYLQKNGTEVTDCQSSITFASYDDLQITLTSEGETTSTTPTNADYYIRKNGKWYKNKGGASGGTSGGGTSGGTGTTLPTPTTDDNGKFLQVVDGAYALVALTDVSVEGA